MGFWRVEAFWNVGHQSELYGRIVLICFAAHRKENEKTHTHKKKDCPGTTTAFLIYELKVMNV